MSQWAEVVFQLREPSFNLNGGVPHEGSLALMGWGFQKKSLNGGGVAPTMPLQLWETLGVTCSKKIG